MKVTTVKAAELLGVSRDTALRWAKSGKWTDARVLSAEQVDYGDRKIWMLELDIPDDPDAPRDGTSDEPQSVGIGGFTHLDDGDVAASDDADYMGSSSPVSDQEVQLAVLEARIEGLERLLDQVMGERDMLRQQMFEAQNAARELRFLLQRRDDRLLLEASVSEPRKSWWSRLLGR